MGVDEMTLLVTGYTSKKELKAAADKPPSRAPAKPAKHKDEPKDPKRCIAAGGRMRCLDCRCGLPSPNNVTIEKMPNYGTKSGHGGKRPTRD